MKNIMIEMEGIQLDPKKFEKILANAPVVDPRDAKPEQIKSR